MVRVRQFIPDIYIDLRYATCNNFTKTIIYSYKEAWLRFGTVKKLRAAQEQLKEKGYSLCIWDAFRSAEAQDRLWDAYPDANYVANPANGNVGHTRGSVVDITLVTDKGKAVEMPSDFDSFTPAADRDYSDVSEQAKSNAQLLENVMRQNGFNGYQKEWWHYSDTNNYLYLPDIDFKPAW